MKKNQTLIIIGNGMAANRVLEELGTDHPFSEVHILSDEAIAHYNRIMLSPLLAKETTLADITPHDADWYLQHRTTIHLSTPVTAVDRVKKIVFSNDIQFSYDALIIATGSRSFIPPVTGSDAENVIGFRTMSDVDAMESRLHSMQHVTVIGAGLLGVEAATGLQSRGVKTTLIHRNTVLMNRQLDGAAADILYAELNHRGVDVRTATSPVELIKENNQVHKIIIEADSHQQTLHTDLIVFATGITPNKEPGELAGIDCNRGVVVNAHMTTSDPYIFALGECCEYEKNTYGLVAPIWDQARVLAKKLTLRFTSDKALHDELEKQPYRERTHLTKLKVSGLDMHSIGRFDIDEEDTEAGIEILRMSDIEMGIYKKLVLQNNRVFVQK